MEESLKSHYLQTKNNNEQGIFPVFILTFRKPEKSKGVWRAQPTQRTQEEIVFHLLTQSKTIRKRECEICKADYNKNSLILEDLVKERTNLEKFAKQLQGTL